MMHWVQEAALHADVVFASAPLAHLLPGVAPEVGEGVPPSQRASS